MRTCQAKLLLFSELEEALRRAAFYLMHSDSVLLFARFLTSVLIFDWELVSDNE